MNTLYDLLSPPKQKWRLALDTQHWNEIYAYQRNKKWCWAAGVQMLAAYSGLEIAQEDLAANVCSVDSWGRPNDCGADISMITEELYICGQQDEYEYCLNPELYLGQPNLEWLKNQLESRNPVLIAYRPPSAPMGHIVLITGIEYYYQNNRLYVSKFIVRDPDPTVSNVLKKGRKEYIKAKQFYNQIYAFWDVSVSITPIYNYANSFSGGLL